jgi:ribosomal protein L11 methylase PrmA
MKQRALIDSLQRTVAKLDWIPDRTEWADYAENNSYSAESAAAKDNLVEAFLESVGGKVVWDIGANTGRFSGIAARLGRTVVAWDIDPAATERHYRLLRREGVDAILPLVLDIANPSPALGWEGRERKSLDERSNADVVLALALVHHLAISRNVPLERIAAYLARLAPALVIEFVPKDDDMVRRLLATREDVFESYTLDGFRQAFDRWFDIAEEGAVAGTPRVLFRMARRS